MSRIHPVDRHVGQRVRLARLSKGMSQTRLAESVGLTFQQIQKYEKGTNRVGASRLQAISDILGVPVSFLFEDAPGTEGSVAKGFSEDSSVNFAMEFCTSAEGLQLNRAFVRIGDPKVRRKIIELVKTLATDGE